MRIYDIFCKDKYGNVTFLESVTQNGVKRAIRKHRRAGCPKVLVLRKR